MVMYHIMLDAPNQVKLLAKSDDYSYNFGVVKFKYRDTIIKADLTNEKIWVCGSRLADHCVPQTIEMIKKIMDKVIRIHGQTGIVN